MIDHDTINRPTSPQHDSVIEISEPCRDGEADGGRSSLPHMMCHERVAPGASSVESSVNENVDNLNTISTLAVHNNSMDFSFIREEDADILEQGVEEKRGYHLADFDDEGRRLQASESNASLTELESEAMSAAEEGQLDSSILSQSSADCLILGDIVDESSNDLSAPSSIASPLKTAGRHAVCASSSSDNNLSMPAIAEDSSYNHAHHDPDNISWPQNHVVDNHEPQEILSENNDFFFGSTSPLTPSKPKVQGINHEELAKRTSSGRAHHRSASFDRRMIESAQFAEAVGEEPDSLLLKKIIEEDSSSDFDDDDIDGEDNLIPNDEDQIDLVDYEDGVGGIDRQSDVAGEEPAGESSQEKIEPTCVSTDLAKMSIKGDGGSDEAAAQQPGEPPQLPTSLEEGGEDSAQVTPAPSPCVDRSKMSLSLPLSTTSFHPPCYVDWKFTRQNSSSSNLDGNNARNKGSLPSSLSGEAEFDYRGIRAKQLEITKRGMSRGNYAQLHRKAWLEVSDKHHRYGKNLRMYYKHWETLGHPFHLFFDWLDSKGEAMGSPLPNLPEIPRTVLDSDTVLYITNPEISASYALDIIANPADGSAIILDQNGGPIDTGKEGWIFVLRDHVLYGSQKVTAPTSSTTNEPSASPGTSTAATPRQRFHHSSFFGGKAVASAGIFLTDEQGRLTQLYPHSGHYRPGEAHMQRALFFFQQHGVELSTFVVDMQQIFKVSRKQILAPKGGNAASTATDTKQATDANGKDKENNATGENGKQSQVTGQEKNAQPSMKKSKKTDCLHLMCGLEVACFLGHKALMIENGVFHQIHKIRRIFPKSARDSVRTILEFVQK